jgi:hypothetical protein
VVTYAVIDPETGTMLSSHPSLEAAKADAQHADAQRDGLSIYVFDDTGFNGGECCEPSRSPSSWR